jgi:ABC-2 type transport system permease protein
VIAIALLCGFRPQAGPLEWLAVAALLLALMTANSWLAACFGLLAKSVEAANAATFIAAFAPYVSSAFVPPDSMPGGLSWVAEHQPVTPIADTIRELLLGLPVGDEAFVAVAWCVAGIAAGRLGAAYLFRTLTR